MFVWFADDSTRDRTPVLTPAPLPTFRVADGPTFTNTGVNFSGPLFIRTDLNQKVTNQQKAISLVPDLSATSSHLFTSFEDFQVDVVYHEEQSVTTLRHQRS